jgi:hypothetical protein
VTRALRSLVCLLALAGCESIVGIEDHGFQAKASSPQCGAYCDVVMRNCTGTNAVYSTRETCLGVCAKLPGGDSVEPMDSNTIECRQRQAALAEREAPFYCPKAGPGGGGKCGTNCAAYCSLLTGVCPNQANTLNDCAKQCSALKDVGTFDVVANHSGDTLQCRLVHVSSATVEDTANHCSHAQLHPTAPWCIDNPLGPPDCQDFCRLEKSACAGDNNVYETLAQCLAVCAALPPGTNGDRDQNTVGCRQWHSYNSLIDAVAHCPHTAPGGDGHCGADQPDDTGNCHSYCILLEKACGAEFMATFGGVQANCQKDCSMRPDAKHDSGYKVATAVGDTMACRLLHVSQALSEPMECAAALGDAPCK